MSFAHGRSTKSEELKLRNSMSWTWKTIETSQILFLPLACDISSQHFLCYMSIPTSISVFYAFKVQRRHKHVTMKHGRWLRSFKCELDATRVRCTKQSCTPYLETCSSDEQHRTIDTQWGPINRVTHIRFTTSEPRNALRTDDTVSDARINQTCIS